MQPERPIEKLLHAFARKRRDQAGDALDLHPATRRTLQGEIQRQYSEPGAARKSGWPLWTRLWPRLAFAGGTLAVLVIAVVLLIPPAHDRQSVRDYAKMESAAPQQANPVLSPPRSVAPAAAPESSPQLARPERQVEVKRLASDSPAVVTLAPTTGPGADVRLAPSRDRGVVPLASPTATAEADSQRATSPAPSSLASTPGTTRIVLTETPSSPLGTGPAKPQADYSSRSSGANRDSVSTLAGRPTTRTSPVNGLAEEQWVRFNAVEANRSKVAALNNESGPEDLAKGLNTQRQDAYRTELPSAQARRNATAAQAVLTSFQFEQRGPEIRIVDADGSVYAGTIQLGGPPAAALATRPQPVPVRAPQAEAQKYGTKTLRSDSNEVRQSQALLNFQVRGTNATLNQAVVFVGNVQPNFLPGFPAAGNYLGSNTARFQNHAPALLPASDSTLTGRARLADGTELEINARFLPTELQR